MKKKIYCFDFDGTLTTSDTLLEFIKYAKGTSRFLMVFLKYSPLLVLMKLHLYPNWKAKQQIFAHLFAGMRIEKFDALCRGFAEESQHLLRPKGITLMHEALVAGAQVFIVSASIDNWVRPFFDIRNLKGVQVLGTQIEVEDGKLTGNFKSNNCYGKEKVHRIAEALKPFERSEYEIEAFGDSRGDKEMLAFADKGHFKPFRE
ncbi:haloacid dehalogenase-like hydrolase [Prevotella copri]|jgi:phosphatidylglycerophosphatase C|uniref:Haloacid dehalogenase-like hydrolase n=1 Tax=Segatella copri TaxID=165179 RepID=A0AAP3BDT3_9BACT|nr:MULTISPECIES: HAD family hydrolase [Prevotellaceae]MCW4128131.1 haloacid dehalogenase-like hydrolase [Segatella copri]MCW4415638.1 haloacid dehalogenase-like hydrolase [Segatella copri]MCW4421499.1 haloacid dehalogenase-like hydrolase [Segatella copri]RHC78719.1 haloacid dehalogenase-like hydrolase [Prevotella sp. AM34-19LB]